MPETPLMPEYGSVKKGSSVFLLRLLDPLHVSFQLHLKVLNVEKAIITEQRAGIIATDYGLSRHKGPSSNHNAPLSLRVVWCQGATQDSINAWFNCVLRRDPVSEAR